MDPLPFIRVPFEKNDLSFGKFGSFFCLTLLILSMFCFSSALESSGETGSQMISSFSERRIMQAVNGAYCPPSEPQNNIYVPSLNFLSILNDRENWLIP